MILSKEENMTDKPIVAVKEAQPETVLEDISVSDGRGTLSRLFGYRPRR